MDIVNPDIDVYLSRLSDPRDVVHGELEARAADENFPNVGPQVGRLLALLASTSGAVRILELGSGFGYSAYWFLQGLPANGHVTMTDYRADRMADAAGYLDRAGYVGQHAGLSGDALQHAHQMVDDGVEAFDILFADIDKKDYPKVLTLAKSLLKVGGLLIVDNMLWSGRVLAPGPDDVSTLGVLELTRLILESDDYRASLIPMRDGVIVAERLR